MVCNFVERRTTRSVKVAKKKPRTIQKNHKLIAKKPKVVKKAKAQVKQRVSPSVAMETVPRMYRGQPWCMQYVTQTRVRY